MATYTVSYRGKNGERIEEQFEAPDRNSLFKILADRKISAISVKDGAAPKRKKSSTPSKPLPPAVIRSAFVVVALVAVAVVAWFLVSDGESPRTVVESKAEKQIKEVVPAKSNRADIVKEERQVEDPARKARREKLAKMSVEERINFRFEELAKEPAELDPSTGKAYRNGLEQVMSWLFTCEVGNAPPVLPDIPIQDEAHLVSILISPNDIVEGDDEEVQQAKKAVEVAKSELIKYIKEGGDVKSFLKFYHNELVQANEEYNMAHQEVKSLAHKDPEIAVEYFNRINSRLIERGIKTIRPNKRLLDLAEEQGVELKY